MNHEERLEKLASGEIKGVRLERSTEWITQVIATGFLFLGGIVRAAMMIRTGEPIPEQPVEDSPRRGRPKTKNYPEIGSEQAQDKEYREDE